MATRMTAGAATSALLDDRARPVTVGGLAVGAVLGFGGNFVDPGHTQDVLYGVSALGLVVASVVLAVSHASTGRWLAAAGFGVLALGETRVLNPVEAPGSEASLAAGLLLYAPGLLLVALSMWGPLWVRLVGALAAVPFAAHGVAYLAGADIDHTDPLAGIGYGLLTITVVGWILTVLRSDDTDVPHPGSARS